jgi:hypothetical protein
VFGDEIAIDRINLLFCKYTIKIAIECVDTIILDMGSVIYVILVVAIDVGVLCML